jgi:hypothetical protein
MPAQVSSAGFFFGLQYPGQIQIPIQAALIPL